MMKKILFFAIVMAALGMTGHAQRVPSWMKELPKPSNDTYLYVKESGDGSSRNNAYNQAMARVLQSTANRIGQPFDSKVVNEALQRGTGYEVISSQYNIPINKVDDYDMQLKDGTWRVYVLCKVAKAGNVHPDWGENGVEANDGASLLKSVFVPGLGQMGKGYQGEGVATLVGEVAFVGTGLGCYFMAKDKLSIMRNYSTEYADFVAARDSYNTLRTVSIISWSAAGALYVFNLYRAYFAPMKQGSGFVFEPALLQYENKLTPALGITFRF